MTFEILLKPLQAERKPYLLLFMTFLITTVSIILAFNIFPKSASILIITFCIIPLIPIMVKIIEIEEIRFVKSKRWYRIGNYRLIRLYTYIFLGFIISFAFYYTILPSSKTAVVFKEQIDTLYNNEPISTHMTDQFEQKGLCDTGILSKYIDKYNFTDCKIYDYYNDGKLEYLIWLDGKKDPSMVFRVKNQDFVPYKRFIRGFFFASNLKVLIFVFLTSFIFGSGALFVLTWNASIIGAFIGESAIRFANLFANVPFSRVSAFFTALPISLGSLLLHGIPEVLGFFIAALAGGILSAAILKHKVISKEFTKISIDSLALFGISVLFILIAAFLESI